MRVSTYSESVQEPIWFDVPLGYSGGVGSCFESWVRVDLACSRSVLVVWDILGSRGFFVAGWGLDRLLCLMWSFQWAWYVLLG